MNSNKQFGVIVAGFLILAIINTGAWLFPRVQSSSGTGALAAEDYNPVIKYNGGYYSALPIETTSTLTVAGASSLTGLVSFGSGGIKVGSSGTTYTLIKSGTCVLTSNSSIFATSTGQATCATTGSLAGDIVYLNLATTTTAVTKQFVLLPNTVAGTDTTTVTVANFTGAAGVPGAVATLGSSTQYQIWR